MPDCMDGNANGGLHTAEEVNPDQSRTEKIRMYPDAEFI